MSVVKPAMLVEFAVMSHWLCGVPGSWFSRQIGFEQVAAAAPLAARAAERKATNRILIAIIPTKVKLMPQSQGCFVLSSRAAELTSMAAQSRSRPEIGRERSS